jgi:hypothetical protein
MVARSSGAGWFGGVNNQEEGIMSELTNEVITQQATETVAEAVDIRSRVRDLTLNAIRQRHLEAAQVREVVKALLEGVNFGLERRAQDSKAAMSEAFAGLDEALQKSAEASHLALQQLSDDGKEFSESDLTVAVENLKQTEREFMAVISEVAAAAGERVKTDWQELVLHATRTGTDTGRQVAETVGAFSRRMSGVAQDARVVGGGAARQLSTRFVQVASGILAGVTDAIRDKKP